MRAISSRSAGQAVSAGEPRTASAHTRTTSLTAWARTTRRNRSGRIPLASRHRSVRFGTVGGSTVDSRARANSSLAARRNGSPPWSIAHRTNFHASAACRVSSSATCASTRRNPRTRHHWLATECRPTLWRLSKRSTERPFGYACAIPRTMDHVSRSMHRAGISKPT
jgi:hypothetical protein